METLVTKKTPLHIGIIMDGNRRYAKKLLLQPWLGHEAGAKKVEELFDWCKELGIKQATLYTFSVENFQRSKEEVEFLMKIFREKFNRMLKDKKIMDEKIRINFIGRTHLFGEEIEEMMKELMEKTKNNDNYIVNFAMGYGGRHEIADAAKKIALKVKNGEIDPEKIDEETVRQNLYLGEYPDLVIRTSGEKRISDFLIWQAAYSEYFFVDKTWPEFSKEDLIAVVNEFGNRNRRFGK